MVPYLRKLTETDLGYIAGSFDGEGNIGISCTRSPYGHLTYRPMSAVHNTNIVFLNHLKSLTQIGVIEPSREGSTTRKPTYKWTLRQPEMLYLLPKIIPYLIIKSRQAEYVLELISLEPNTKGNVDPELSKRRAELYEFCKSLNQRGPN